MSIQSRRRSNQSPTKGAAQSIPAQSISAPSPAAPLPTDPLAVAPSPVARSLSAPHSPPSGQLDATVGPERDIGRFVGLIGTGAWLLFGLFVVIFVAIAVLADGPALTTVPGAVGLILVILGALLVAVPSPTPLPRVFLSVIWAIMIVSTWLLLQGVPTDAGPGFRVWSLGACNFILFAVAVRGRAAGAWIGEALLIATVLAWSWVETGSIWFGVSFSYGQPVSLIAGMAFAIGLHSVARQIFEYQDADRVRAADAAGRAEADAQRHRGLDGVRELAEPILRAIADRVSPERSEVVGLEASLRDRIRARHLAIEPLSSVLTSMRELGTQVLLLDDSEPLQPTDEQAREIAEWCVARLREASSSSLTIRLAPIDDSLVVSVVGDDGYSAEITI